MTGQDVNTYCHNDVESIHDGQKDHSSFVGATAHFPQRPWNRRTRLRHHLKETDPNTVHSRCANKPGNRTEGIDTNQEPGKAVQTTTPDRSILKAHDTAIHRQGGSIRPRTGFFCSTPAKKAGRTPNRCIPDNTRRTRPGSGSVRTKRKDRDDRNNTVEEGIKIDSLFIRKRHRIQHTFLHTFWQ